MEADGERPSSPYGGPCQDKVEAEPQTRLPPTETKMAGDPSSPKATGGGDAAAEHAGGDAADAASGSELKENGAREQSSAYSMPEQLEAHCEATLRDRGLSSEEAQKAIAEAKSYIGSGDALKEAREAALVPVMLGLPFARVLLRDVARRCGALDIYEAAQIEGLPLAASAEDMEAQRDLAGAWELTFEDKKKRTRRAWIRMGRARPAHRLGDELRKIFRHVGEEKRKAVQDHLSMLLRYGGVVYGKAFRLYPELARRMREKLPGFDPMKIAVAKENSTAFIEYPDGTTSDRVGFYVTVGSPESGESRDSAENA